MSAKEADQPGPRGENIQSDSTYDGALIPRSLILLRGLVCVLTSDSHEEIGSVVVVANRVGGIWWRNLSKIVFESALEGS